MRNSVTWKIGGEAGFGIISSGTMLAKAFSRAGYHVLVTNEYPSLIRGGHNVVTVRAATAPFASLNRDLHILVALNRETIDNHKTEVTSGAFIVSDPKDYTPAEGDFSVPVVHIALPMGEIVKSQNGAPVMRNTVALGAAVALAGGEFAALEKVITDQFGKKGPEVVASNVALAKAGFEAVKTQYADHVEMVLEKKEKGEDQLIINGSEAFGVGAVRAGLKFAAIYPMTPINALISFLADHAKSANLVYKQPEDEIAGINMAIGASVAGVRSMVATSGGGFALMVEGLSLAGNIEAPLVIDMGMRVGPATGMPTWTEQGELAMVIHAGHGEFPRIVLAPADAQEAYEFSALAFNLADRYQVAVIVLTDKYLNESIWCVPKPVFTKPVTIDRGKLTRGSQLPADGSYKRYDLSAPDGVSARSVPGEKGGFFYANSYEHDEIGHSTEDGAARTAMADKRLKKLKAMQKDIMKPQVFGDSEGEFTFVTWGTTRGPVIEAIQVLAASGKKARLVHFPWLYPFPTEDAMKLLASSTRIIDVEQNSTAQLAALIREHTGILIKEKILKYDGRPFYPEEIVEKVMK